MNRNVIIVCVTAVILFGLGLVGWISATGGNPEQVIGWFGIIAAPTLVSLLAYVRSDQTKQSVDQIHELVAETHGDVQTVKTQTNGLH